MPSSWGDLFDIRGIHPFFFLMSDVIGYAFRRRASVFLMFLDFHDPRVYGNVRARQAFFRIPAQRCPAFGTADLPCGQRRARPVPSAHKICEVRTEYSFQISEMILNPLRVEVGWGW